MEGYYSILYILVLVAILYFMMIRPQQQRQKKQQEMIDSLRVNDRVITVGGIHGSVVAIMDNTLKVKIAEDVQIELQKNAVGQKIEEYDDDDE